MSSAPRVSAQPAPARRQGRWHLLLAGLAAVGLVAAAFLVPLPQARHLSAQERLKTQYFDAVCLIEPFWFDKVFSNTPVADTLKFTIQDMAQDLHDFGGDPNRAAAMVSYFLKVDPEGVLGGNTTYVLGTAKDNGLVDKHLRPTIGPARAAKMWEDTRRQYQALTNQLDDYGETWGQQRELCSPIQDGRVVGNGAPR